MTKFLGSQPTSSFRHGTKSRKMLLRHRICVTTDQSCGVCKSFCVKRWKVGFYFCLSLRSPCWWYSESLWKESFKVSGSAFWKHLPVNKLFSFSSWSGFPDWLLVPHLSPHLQPLLQPPFTRLDFKHQHGTYILSFFHLSVCYPVSLALLRSLPLCAAASLSAALPL